jgi:hypothetical protein
MTFFRLAARRRYRRSLNRPLSPVRSQRPVTQDFVDHKPPQDAGALSRTLRVRRSALYDLRRFDDFATELGAPA